MIAGIPSFSKQMTNSINPKILDRADQKGHNRKKSGDDEVAVVRIDPEKRAAGGKLGADLPAVDQPTRLRIHSEGLEKIEKKLESGEGSTSVEARGVDGGVTRLS
jgi:hypothetical protein